VDGLDGGARRAETRMGIAIEGYGA